MSSFYGQIGNITSTHFQFDKIYPNRRAMDLELLNQKDNIFAGRFVLVNYNSEDLFTLPNVQIGYRLNEDGTQFYQDISGQIPFIYSDFLSFSSQGVNRDSPSASVLSNYYFKNDVYFFKMPTDIKYYSADDYNYYYTPVETASTAIVGTGWILREYYQRQLTSNFYQCVGHNGTIPQWQKISNNSNLIFSYLNNYKIDQNAYLGSFDVRGYNATIWQKIYSGGTGYFSLVARLECTPPTIELYPEAPSLNPVSPYIDSNSTDQAYCIRVPTQWGLQFKKVEDAEAEDYNKSDQVLIRDGVSYDADIYMNLGGSNRTVQQNYHKINAHKDTTTKNEILIEPTGQSGKLYNGAAAEDILEVSIHTPVFGNMIDEGYDLIYGVNNDENATRPRDVQWYYGGIEAENLKQNGDTFIGGKTYDLNTLAGSLNTIHSILGQNIIKFGTKPDISNILNYSQNYIYYIEDEDKYYYIDTTYQYSELTNSSYLFNTVSVDPNMYETDTYYYLQNGQYKVSQNVITETTTLYQRNVKNDIYTVVDPQPIKYESGRYFLHRGVDYILDNANWPSASEEQYYSIDAFETKPGSFFDSEYAPNTLWYKDEQDNYVKDLSSTIVDGRIYESLTIQSYAPSITQGITFYHKDLLFYKEDINSPYISCSNYATFSSLPNNVKLYCLIFDETQSFIIADDNGEPVLGHPLKRAIEIDTNYMFDIPNNTDNLYFKTSDGTYVAFKNIDFTNTPTGSDIPFYATRLNYYRLTTTALTNIYRPGAYYIRIANGSYILSYDALNKNQIYYSLTEINLLTQPFYIPGQYYYESSTDVFELDQSLTFYASRMYYEKEKIYVVADYTNRCPYGYEWNNNSIFVPASVTLATRTEQLDFVEMNYLEDMTGSINAHLLSLARNLKVNNDEGRDKSTLWGAFNMLKDYLYVLHTLKPDQMLMVNAFGQIVSIDINPTKLQHILNKYDEIMNL